MNNGTKLIALGFTLGGMIALIMGHITDGLLSMILSELIYIGSVIKN